MRIQTSIRSAIARLRSRRVSTELPRDSSANVERTGEEITGPLGSPEPAMYWGGCAWITTGLAAVVAVVVLTLSGVCAFGSRVPRAVWTATPTDAPTPTQETPLEEASKTPAASDPTATSEPTATPPPTVVTPDCTLGAVFQADVTVPDNTRLEVGQPFTKTWRLRNTGTCTWGPGYRLAFIDGDQMDGSDTGDVPETRAGQSADISVALVAPMEVGRHRGNWQMRVGEGEYFGQKVFVQIITFASPALSPAPDLQGAAYLDEMVGALVKRALLDGW